MESDCSGALGLEAVANGHMVSFLGDENVLKLIMVMAVRLCKYTENN